MYVGRVEKLLAFYSAIPMCVINSQGKVTRASRKIVEVFKYDGIVDGDIFVLNVFLNTKLAISNIGHNIINTHIIFSSFILCFMSCFFLPILLFFLYCKYFRIYFICNFIY